MERDAIKIISDDHISIHFTHKINEEETAKIITALKNPSLVHLEIAVGATNCESSQCIADAILNSSVTHLRCRLYRNHSSHNRDFACFLKNKSLTTFEPVFLAVNLIEIINIMEAIPSSSITTLDFSHSRLSLEHIEAIIMRVSKGSLLRTLNLSNNKIGDGCVKIIASGIAQTSLTELILSWNKLKINDCKEIGQMLKCSPLTSINLSNNDMGDDEAVEIANGLEGSSLTRLDLSHNNIQVEGARAIAKKLKYSSLTDINLSNNNVGIEGAKCFAKALKKSSLSTLNLTSNDIKNQGLIHFANELESSPLTTLILSFNQISYVEISGAIAKLVTSSLTFLDLNGNYLKDEGAIEIAHNLKYSSLTSIILRNNRIGCAGVTEIARSLALVTPPLILLDLSANKIEHVGAIEIAHALDALNNSSNSSLTSLNLSHNNIGCEGCEIIVRKCKSKYSRIASLYLNDNAVIPSKQRAIIELLRDTDVITFTLGSKGSTQAIIKEIVDENKQRLNSMRFNRTKVAHQPDRSDLTLK